MGASENKVIRKVGFIYLYTPWGGRTSAICRPNSRFRSHWRLTGTIIEPCIGVHRHPVPRAGWHAGNPGPTASCSLYTGFTLWCHSLTWWLKAIITVSLTRSVCVCVCECVVVSACVWVWPYVLVLFCLCYRCVCYLRSELLIEWNSWPLWSSPTTVSN